MESSKILEKSSPTFSGKPLLRGYLHQEAFFMSIGACTLLIAKATNQITAVAASVYSFGLLFLFGVSAFYHRPHWTPERRAMLKRLDHAAIFILIASTATPISLLALNSQNRFELLVIIWNCAFLGVLQSICWIKAPRFLTALLYIIMGWMSLIYFGPIKEALGLTHLTFLIVGGIFYSVGAVAYAFKKPKIIPHIFGYHELFHLFTIIAAAFHFAVVYHLMGLAPSHC